MQRGHYASAPDFRESQSFVTLTNYDSRGLVTIKPDQFFPVLLQACSVLDEIELRSGTGWCELDESNRWFYIHVRFFEKSERAPGEFPCGRLGFLRSAGELLENFREAGFHRRITEFRKSCRSTISKDYWTCFRVFEKEWSSADRVCLVWREI